VANMNNPTLVSASGEKVAKLYDYKKLGFMQPVFSQRTKGRTDQVPNSEGKYKVTKSQGVAIASFTLQELGSCFVHLCGLWLDKDSVTIQAYAPFVSYGNFGRVASQETKLNTYLDTVLDEFLDRVLVEWDATMGEQNEQIDLRPVIIPEKAERKKTSTARSGGRTF